MVSSFDDPEKAAKFVGALKSLDTAIMSRSGLSSTLESSDVIETIEQGNEVTEEHLDQMTDATINIMEQLLLNGHFSQLIADTAEEQLALQKERAREEERFRKEQQEDKARETTFDDLGAKPDREPNRFEKMFSNMMGTLGTFGKGGAFALADEKGWGIGRLLAIGALSPFLASFAGGFISQLTKDITGFDIEAWIKENGDKWFPKDEEGNTKWDQVLGGAATTIVTTALFGPLAGAITGALNFVRPEIEKYTGELPDGAAAALSAILGLTGANLMRTTALGAGSYAGGALMKAVTALAVSPVTWLALGATAILGFALSEIRSRVDTYKDNIKQYEDSMNELEAAMASNDKERAQLEFEKASRAAADFGENLSNQMAAKGRNNTLSEEEKNELLSRSKKMQDRLRTAWESGDLEKTKEASREYARLMGSLMPHKNKMEEVENFLKQLVQSDPERYKNMSSEQLATSMHDAALWYREQSPAGHFMPWNRPEDPDNLMPMIKSLPLKNAKLVDESMLTGAVTTKEENNRSVANEARSNRNNTALPWAPVDLPNISSVKTSRPLSVFSDDAKAQRGTGRSPYLSGLVDMPGFAYEPMPATSNMEIKTQGISSPEAVSSGNVNVFNQGGHTINKGGPTVNNWNYNISNNYDPGNDLKADAK